MSISLAFLRLSDDDAFFTSVSTVSSNDARAELARGEYSATSTFALRLN